MANSNYYSEGKYSCNHPESDFKVSSTNPIEMKKENFVEYTHRNETANYRYDVWNGSENVTEQKQDPLITLDRDNFENVEDYYTYVKVKANSAKLDTLSQTNKKKSAPPVAIIIFILIYVLPILLSIIGTIFSAITDML